MTDDAGLDGDDRAIRALADGDDRGAADAYVLGAYGTLAGHEGFQREGFAERTEAGRAVYHRITGDEAGTLHAPRGSTEYGTDFRCPDCGAMDVNYVAEAVLCLRCDAPIEFRS